MLDPQSGQSDTMQVYSQSGKSITIKRSALSAAQKQGWSPNAPSKVDGGAAQPQVDPNKSSMAPIGFGKGFAGGLNPFHSVPAGMPEQPGVSGIEKFGEDLVNAREIGQRIYDKNYAGAAGMTAGTLTSFLGPELIKGAGKGLKEAGAAAKAAKEIPMVAKVAKRAKETAAMLGGGVDTARFAERYVAPLREALDAKFQPIHDALQGKPMALSNAARQQIRRMSRSELAPVRKLGKELLKRSALDYPEARELTEKALPTLVRQLKKIGGDHWIQEAHTLNEEVEKGIDALAHQNGVKDARDAAKAAYKEVKDLTASVVATAKQKPSGLKRMATAGAGFVGGLAVGHPIAGEIAAIHGFENKGLRLSEEAVAKGIQLAQKLGVDYREMLGAVRTAAETKGTYLERFSKVVRAFQAGGAARRGATPDQ